jgi:hypothetical protein
MPGGAPVVYRRHVWQTPVSREAMPAESAGIAARGSSVVPVWVFIAARKILGDGIYRWLKATLKRER